MNLFRNFLFSLIALTLILQPVGAASGDNEMLFSRNTYEEIRFSIRTPGWETQTREGGAEVITLDGYELNGMAGDPLLPVRAIRLALPPNVDPASLKLDLVAQEAVDLPGTFAIAPALPMAAWVDGEQIVVWGSTDPARIQDGRNLDRYESNSFAPAETIVLEGVSAMRKWKYATLSFQPVQYNPVSGQARLITSADIRLTYDIHHGVLSSSGAEDTIMDSKAAQIFDNIQQAREWYTSYQASDWAPSATGGYVIITTNAIQSASTQLGNFVALKQTQGYTVSIVTESQFGGLTGQTPNGTAEKIREWLKNNYISGNIKFVLLIGNPDPDDPRSSDSVGDIPMKMMFPRYGAPDADQESPTDYFYSDLTGNWNLDGDQYFGEYNGDRGTGGVDFSPEVYVGRIPVYSGVTNLDSILQKMIAYQTSGETAWRKNALLPMSFSDASTDGAYLGNRMMTEYLNAAGFTSTTMYQRGAGCNSYTAPTIEMADNDNGVRDQWAANDYGIVTWWGHGNSTGAYRGYDGAPDYCSGTLFDTGDTSSLDNAHPAFVFQNSCTNGYPEYTNNLGYALLLNGAIGTIPASRVSWYLRGNYSPSYSRGDNSSVAYYSMMDLAGGKTIGEALYDQKALFNPITYAETWMNLMDFNLYGDPSSGLTQEALTPPVAPTALSASAPNWAQINLAWTDNSDNELSFHIERSPDGSTGWTEIVSSAANSVSYVDRAVDCESEYFYRVRAYNGLGYSDYTNTASAVTGTCPVWSDFVMLPEVLKNYQAPVITPFANPGFESGHTGWTEYSLLGRSIIGTSSDPVPHGGSWLARLGGENYESAHIEQAVTIPSGNSYLRYYEWISSEDYCGYDFAYIKVNGTTVQTYDLCEATATGGWVLHTVDLSAYVGQTVTIRIEMDTDVSYPSNLYLDDFTFQSTGGGYVPSTGGIVEPKPDGIPPAPPR